MPGRKSNISQVTIGDDESPAPASRAARDSMGIEDYSLPRTMIQRLAKGVLPANTSIQKDALLALSKSATVFVNFLAANSSEYATMAGKKTIMPNDVYAALKDHEFEAFLPRVQAEVQKYNDIQCDKRNSYRRKVKEDKAAAATSTSGATANGDETHGADDSTVSLGWGGDGAAVNGRAAGVEDEERPAKKQRRASGDETDDDEGDVDVDEDVGEGVEEDEEADDDADDDEMEDAVEEQAEEEEEDGDELDHDRLGGPMRDEALDEPDSD